MPGKHAPASSKSFLISLGTAAGGALAALAVVVGIALVALNAGSDKAPADPAIGSTPPRTTPPPSPSASATQSVLPSESASPAGELTPVERTTLRILNGSGTAGQAARMAERAKNEGYPSAKVGNADDRAPKSTVFYAQGAREEAKEFQRRFPEFTEMAAAPSSFATDVMLTIVIGSDYPKPSASPSPSAS